MKYILKEKMPIPCDDEDLWNAWYKEENYLIDKYETENITVTAEFIGKPLKRNEENKTCKEGPLLFQVTAIFKDKTKPAAFSFYATWQEAEKRFQTLCPATF